MAEVPQRWIGERRVAGDMSVYTGVRQKGAAEYSCISERGHERGARRLHLKGSSWGETVGRGLLYYSI